MAVKVSVSPSLIYLLQDKCKGEVLIGSLTSLDGWPQLLKRTNMSPVCLLKSASVGLTFSQVQEQFAKFYMRRKGTNVVFIDSIVIFDWFYKEWQKNIRNWRTCSTTFNVDVDVSFIGVLERGNGAGFKKHTALMSGVDEKYKAWKATKPVSEMERCVDSLPPYVLSEYSKRHCK